MALFEVGVPSRGWRRTIRRIDWTLLLLLSLALGLGLISIYSATSSADMRHFFSRQLLSTALGLGTLVLTARLPRLWLERLAPIAYGVGVLLLVAVLLLGRTVYGSKSWLSFGGFSFQPVEAAKVTTLLMLARLLSDERRSLRQAKTLAQAFGIVALPTVLVLLQPDAGSALVLGALFIGILLWGKAHPLVVLMPILLLGVALLPLFGTLALLLGILVSSVAIFLTRPRVVPALLCIAAVAATGWSSSALYRMLKPHQQARLQTFLNPEADPRGSGYHSIQSVLAIGSGGLTGKGFQKGTQTQLRFIPKQWTDFIFCVPAEEFGFLGATVVLAVLFGILWHVFTLAYRFEHDPFWSLLLAGTGTLWFFHTAVNIGMALGLAPVIGLPLPFLSAGGSALIANLTLAGLVFNAYRHL